jgi:hypothetical protein
MDSSFLISNYTSIPLLIYEVPTPARFVVVLANEENQTIPFLSCSLGFKGRQFPFCVNKPGDVLKLFGEDSVEDVTRRLEAIATIATTQQEAQQEQQASEDPKSSVNVAALGAVGGAVGGAVVGGVVAPVAVVGTVSAMGFGTSGIVAGSLASTMMASSATATGGGVVASSTVAVLQSIGATLGTSALSAVPIGIAIAGGVLIGAGLIGGLVYGGIKLHEHLNEKENEQNNGL